MTTSEPSTGPSVQKPIADPRPTWGEKSRTSAAVPTSTTPSTRLSTAKQAANSNLVSHSGKPTSVISAVDRDAVGDEVGAAPAVGQPGGE